MEKISINQFSKNNFSDGQKKLDKVRTYIIKNTGMTPESIRLNKGSIVVKAKNNYEATEIRLKIQNYIDNNNIRVVS
jgi:hypothetical protein